MIVFVRLQTPSSLHTSVYNLEVVEWSLLCCGRDITLIIRPNYSAQPAGHLVFLSRTFISAIIYPTKWVSTSHPLKFDRPCRAIRSAYMGRLGQRALVFKSRHQFDVWSIGDIVTAVGAALSQGCPPTLQPPQASTYSCVLQARCREAAYSLGSRSTSNAAPYIHFPLLCWPFRVSVWCSHHYFQGSDYLDRCMCRFIHNTHVLADHSQGQPLFRTTFFLVLFLSHRHTISLIPSSSAVPTYRPLHLHSSSQSRPNGCLL